MKHLADRFNEAYKDAKKTIHDQVENEIIHLVEKKLWNYSLSNNLARIRVAIHQDRAKNYAEEQA